MTLHLPADVLAQVVGHAKRAHPVEACGIIAGPAGQPTGGDVVADRVIPMANAAPDPAAGFIFDSTDQLAAYADMDARGEDPVVLYHSHPAGPANPSARDIAGAIGGTCLWLIAAMAGPHVREFRCWRIVSGQPVEEQIHITAVDGDSEPRSAQPQPH